MSLNNSGIRKFLLPFSFLYGIGVWVRNTLFEMGILDSKRADIPVIGVGNITVGGTGKTPMTEYLARLLNDQYQVAILSRGYKRKSKGFVVGSDALGVDELGDEPTQMMRKITKAVVAVDKNRRRGLDLLSAKEQNPRIDVVLLDDAFQHRYVIPGLNILLVDFNRPISNDYLLPAGNLREPSSHHKRADIVVFTKCPPTLPPIDRRITWLETKPYPFQSVFFTSLEYGQLLPVKKNLLEGEPLTSMEQIHEKNLPVLIIVGIASPAPFIDYVKTYCPLVKTMIFTDHHRFTDKEVTKIKKTFQTILYGQGVILTTEKDAVRMHDDTRFDSLLPYCYYPSLNIRFFDNTKEEFDEKILNYVQHYK